MEIKYVTLYACSINSEVDFCTGKLGFRVLKRTKILNQKECVILIKENESLGIMLVESDKKNNPSTTIVLNTTDFLKDHFELKHNGITFLSEPEYTPAGLAAAFNDPSGNRWVLIEERDYSIH